MKRILCMVFLVLFLCGCGSEQAVHTRIPVSLVQTDGCAIQENGLWVEPGEDAVFTLDLAYGYSLASTDYAGSYRTELKDGLLILTLENVQYPARVELALTSRFSTITYEPNGGAGHETVRTYDLSHHLRPNTEQGADLFFRDGWTLTSWNTKADGSGTRVGLGSRVSAGMALTLYAQWEKWTDAAEFRYTVTEQDTVTIGQYLGNSEKVVIPARIGGREVTAVASGAFENSKVRHIIFPETMDVVEPDSFRNSALETVTLFDNIQRISDDCFAGCEDLRTLYINAVEAPYGYDFRKESIYADKVDLLITAQGQRKLVFYGGCSTWYNLDGAEADRAFGEEYAIINMGLNGTVNSAVQMQIMGAFLEEGDILLHTLELTSRFQLLQVTSMGENDDKLWCGLEYNYDLFALADLRTIEGEFDSFCGYLEKKKTRTDYRQRYTDADGQEYMDPYGCIPFYRGEAQEALPDRVRLDPEYVADGSLERLSGYYEGFRDKGVTVYVSYACVNMDAVPPEQQGNVVLIDELIKSAVTGVISDLEDYRYYNSDYFDTNYHLHSQMVTDNTLRWIRDLKAQMLLDGLWSEPNEETAAP